MSSLASLALSGGSYVSSGYTMLSRFGSSLRELSLAGRQQLPHPGTLAHLTALRALSVQQPGLPGGGGPEDDVWLQAALAALPRLTSLQLLGACSGRLLAFPAELAGLTRLQALDWRWPAPADPALPAGPWLARLLRLALPVSVAAASLPVLSAAWQLEALAANRYDRCGSPAEQLSLVGWAARHPALQRLHLQAAAAPQLAEDVGLAEALKEAAQLAPALHIACEFGGGSAGSAGCA